MARAFVSRWADAVHCTLLITANHLRGLPGLRRAARDRLLAAQPATVLEALAVPDIGRKTTKHLLAIGVLQDPEGVQERGLTKEEWVRRWDLMRRYQGASVCADSLAREP